MDENISYWLKLHFGNTFKNFNQNYVNYEINISYEITIIHLKHIQMF